MTNADRIAAYYVKLAPLIAADSLWHYTRAERGRKFQARFVRPQPMPANVLRLRKVAR